MDISRYIEKEYLQQEALVGDIIRFRTVNSLESELNEAAKLSKDEEYQAKIGSLRRILTDAATISMYNFQFKIFTLTFRKEIYTLKQEANK